MPKIKTHRGAAKRFKITASGKIKRNKGAMFVSLAKAYAKKNNINLNFN